jgi:purine-cytosine permease-like protein
MGHRTGVNVMVLGRMAFGRRGAIVPAAIQLLLTMGWIGVNTWVVLDLAMGAFAEVGVEGGLAMKYAVAFGIMAVQVGIAVWGFYAIRAFERWTVPATAVIMVGMTVLALTRVDVSFTTGTVSGGDAWAAATQLLTAIGIGWGISWMVYASDYSRFVRPAATSRRVWWASAAGMFVPTVWLAALGAAVASAGGGSDPSNVVVTTFGAMALPVLLLILHGPVAGNVLNFYSCSLAALTVGLRVARWKLTLIAAVVASAVLMVFVRADDFAHSFDQWMVSLICWIAPWAAICLVEFFVVRRGRLDPATLYDERARERGGDVNWGGAGRARVGGRRRLGVGVRLRRGDAGAGRQSAGRHRPVLAQRRPRRRGHLLAAGRARRSPCGGRSGPRRAGRGGAGPRLVRRLAAGRRGGRG